jgi:hypothetical protein
MNSDIPLHFYISFRILSNEYLRHTISESIFKFLDLDKIALHNVASFYDAVYRTRSTNTELNVFRYFYETGIKCLIKEDVNFDILFWTHLVNIYNCKNIWEALYYLNMCDIPYKLKYHLLYYNNDTNTFFHATTDEYNAVLAAMNKNNKDSNLLLTTVWHDW